MKNQRSKAKGSDPESRANKQAQQSFEKQKKQFLEALATTRTERVGIAVNEEAGHIILKFDPAAGMAVFEGDEVQGIIDGLQAAKTRLDARKKPIIVSPSGQRLN